MSSGWIDYWCNAFTPEREARWNAAIDAQGIPLRIRPRSGDEFCSWDAMAQRMDALGIATLVLPCSEPARDDDPTIYEHFTTRPDELAAARERHPGRFAGLVTIDPTRGGDGVREARAWLTRPEFVGVHLHTHSWDRPFDHRDLYPYYAAAAEQDLPVVMQAGASGGRMPSECGRPIGIDRPALYFENIRFVLSHAGWPWVDEALAMAGKHPNVFVGTATLPAHHWPPALRAFVTGAGRGRVLLGSGYPVVGHGHALAKLGELGLDAALRDELTHGNARRVFTKLDRAQEATR